MRSSLTVANPIDLGKHNKTIGIALGSDFCAEHEQGIQPLRDLFKIDKNQPGLKRWQIQTNATQMRKSGNSLYLLAGWKYEHLPRDLRECRGEQELQIHSAWDEDSFGIYSNIEKGKKFIERLYYAFEENDILIIAKSMLLFDNPSISLVINSEVPYHVRTQWEGKQNTKPKGLPSKKTIQQNQKS